MEEYLDNLDVDCEEISLRDRGIDVIPGLSRFKNLKKLDLRGNNISDLTPLSNLIKLTYLSLDSNNITDLSLLSNLINLKKLELSIKSFVAKYLKPDIEVFDKELINQIYIEYYKNEIIKAEKYVKGNVKLNNVNIIWWEF